MNKVILIGRLTRDAEIRYSQGADPKAVAKFTLAVNRKYAQDGQQQADFISCVAFGKIAEHIEKYYFKGSKAVICGRIQTGSYKKDDGTTVYTTDVVVEEIEFGESKNASQQTTGTQNTPQLDNNDGFMNIPDGLDEDLPFM